LITPPNGGVGAGIWLPGIVVVALGSPSVPVTTCAVAGPFIRKQAPHMSAILGASPIDLDLIGIKSLHRNKDRAILNRAGFPGGSNV
jgi:hypothetical protein